MEVATMADNLNPMPTQIIETPNAVPEPRKFVSRQVNFQGTMVPVNIEGIDDADIESTVKQLEARPDAFNAKTVIPGAHVFRSKDGGFVAVNSSDPIQAEVEGSKGIANMDAAWAFAQNDSELDDHIENMTLDDRISGLQRKIQEANDEMMKSFGSPNAAIATTGRVAADVVKGVVGAPTHVWDGFTGAIDSVVDTSTQLSNVVMEKIGGEDFANRMARPLTMSQEEWQRGLESGEYNRDDSLFNVSSGVTDSGSVTGNLIRGISQFATGWAAGGQALRGWKTASKAGVITKGLAQGALADFAAMSTDGNLSSFIEQVPELGNPITEYLAGDIDDSELEKRMKNAIEGGIIGIGIELVGPLVKAVQARRSIKPAVEQAQQEAQAFLKAADERDARIVTQANEALNLLGKETDPLVEVVEVVAKRKDRAAKALSENPLAPENIANVAEGQARLPFEEPHPFRVNYNSIETGDDVKAVMEAMLSANTEYFAKAKGGVIPWKVTKMQAGRIINNPDAVNALLGRKPGTAVNAAEMNALEVLAVNSAERLRSIASIATENPTPANMAAFDQMMSAFTLIKGSDLRAASETGRALNLRKALKTTNSKAAEAIMAISKSNDDLLTKAQAIMMATDPKKAADIVEKVAQIKGGERIRSIMQQLHMTMPSTQIANISGNGLAMLFEVAVRSAAPTLVGKGGVADGEGLALFAGMAQSFMKVVRNAPEMQDFVKSLESQNKFGGEVSLFEKSAQSKNTTFAGMAKVANAASSYGVKTAAAVDNYFKYIAHEAALNAAAFRQATKEAQTGLVEQSKDAISNRMTEILTKPTNELIDEAIRLRDEVTYSRSQEYIQADDPIKGMSGMGRGLLQFRQTLEKGGPVGGFAAGAIIPFVNTTSNIMSYGMRSSPLAPLMRRYQEDLIAGGARAEIAQARARLGSVVLWTSFALGMNGTITGGGPADPDEAAAYRRVGWQPNSILVDDKYVSFNRLAPIGMLMAIGGNLGESYQQIADGDVEAYDQWTELTATAAAAIGDAIMDQSLLTGVSNLNQFIADRKSNKERWLNSLVGSMVPAAVGGVERMMDPVQRETMSIPSRNPDSAQAILSNVLSLFQGTYDRLPGVSGNLPIRRDQWGRPIKQGSQQGMIFETFSPVRVSQVGAEPIDIELINLDYFPNNLERKMDLPDVYQVPTKDGKLNLSDRPDIYNEILRLRGEEVLPRLNDLVEGKTYEGEVYQTLDNEDKKDMIQKIMRQGKAIALRKIMEDDHWRNEIESEVDRINYMAQNRQSLCILMGVYSWH